MNKPYLIFVFLALSVSTVASQDLTLYCNTGGTVATFAAWYCSDINQQVIATWSRWLPVALLAVTLSFLVATLIFMFGVAFKNERLRTFGIGEIYEALASALLVSLFMFIAATMMGILPAEVGHVGNIDPYTSSLTFMAQTINQTSVTAKALFLTAATDRYYSTIQVVVCSPSTLATGQSCLTIGKTFGFIIMYLFFWPAWGLITFMLDAMVSLYTQYYMILFFMYASIPVFLVPGVIFRTFMPTRSLGGMMIAIAFGFFFIMPTLYAITWAFTNQSLTSQLTTAESVINKYSSGYGSQSNALTPGSPLVSELATVNQTFNAYWLDILFFPAVNVALSYAFIIQLAELIGGMSRGSSRLRSLV